MCNVNVLKLVCNNGKLEYGNLLILSQINTELWQHLRRRLCQAQHRATVIQRAFRNPKRFSCISLS